MRYFPQMFPSVIFYFLMKGERKILLLQDINSFYKIEYHTDRLSNFTAFYRLMVDYDAFRNVFYYRLKPYHDMLCWLMPKCKTLSIRSLSVGGIYIQHGTSTQLTAVSIGKNF